MKAGAEIFDNVRHLAEHAQVLEAVVRYFSNRSEIAGAFVSGSLVTGGMDQFSDLDLGFLCKDTDSRSKIWGERWDWNIAPWFHRFDADHIKPNFVIYFFEPDIHVDLCFYVQDDLPTQRGAPFKVAWDSTALLTPWARSMNSWPAASPEWSHAVHEDERFWAWIHYSLSHVRRGEYYDIASYFYALRGIVEQWHARLSGSAEFETRRLEMRADPSVVSHLGLCFPNPDLSSLKSSLQALIDIHQSQRMRVASVAKVRWNVSDATRERLRKVVDGL
ncbi:MAG: hypothetical protein AB7T49_06115 [Oligoflexales bacterium]